MNTAMYSTPKKRSWKQYDIAEFPSDFKSGVTFAGNILAVPDEYGNVFYAETKKEP